MAIATLFNTAVHRELSRTTDGQARRGRLFAVAGGLYLVSLGLTTLGLVVAQWLAPSALLAELVALTVANAVRRRLPLRRAAGLDLPPERPRRTPASWRCHDDRPRRPPPDASVGVLDPPGATRPVPPTAPARRRADRAGLAAGPRRGWPARFVRGKESDAAWVRPALLALLVATAVLYLWDLGASGWANSFYSAAVQAGTKSWKAFFFGSSDSSNFITVDKPPAFLWPMEISARIFGLNSWSMLVPQALEGVATVGLVYLAVRRWFSAQAALLGGAVVALTPVAAMMFRYNNPDALLALLLTGATYATMRALEKAQTKWLVLAGALVGFGFITKMMQAFLILPVMAVVYLLAAPTGWWRRVWQVVAHGRVRRGRRRAGGWPSVALTPAADRPYVGGSQNNSILNLIFGYNGFGRLTGNESGSVGGGAGRREPCGARPGWTRLFNAEFGNMMSWLLPGALVMGAVLLSSPSAGPSHRPRAGRAVAVGRLARLHRARHQPGPGHHPPVLHRRPGPAARRARRHRHHGPVAAPRQLGRPRRPGRRPGRHGRLELRAPRPHPDWFPALRPFVVVAGGSVSSAILALPLLRSRPQAGRRPRRRRSASAPRWPRRFLDRGHRGHAAQRRHPVGDTDARRRPGRSRRGGFPGGWRPVPPARWRRSGGPSPAAGSPVAHRAAASPAAHPGAGRLPRRRVPRAADSRAVRRRSGRRRVPRRRGGSVAAAVAAAGSSTPASPTRH